MPVGKEYIWLKNCDNIRKTVVPKHDGDVAELYPLQVTIGSSTHNLLITFEESSEMMVVDTLKFPDQNGKNISFNQ